MCWKVAGALHSPNGITRNSYAPFLVAKAVFGIDRSVSFTCQKPDFKSIELKIAAPSRN
jgi:hypothetical protein